MPGFYAGVEENSVGFGYFMCLVRCRGHGVRLSKFLPDVFAEFDLRSFCYPGPPAKEYLGKT